MSDQQLAESAVRRDRLSAEYVHQLRTPLNHILGFSEMLTEQAQEEGQEGFIPDLESIHTGRATTSRPARPQRESAVRSESACRQRHGAGVIRPGLNRRRVASTLGMSEQAPALILVVDDNRVNRDLLSRRLSAQGHQAVMAENGREALDAVRRQPFDLVLLDIMMPELDGYAVLAEIKADDELCQLPVIMISALDEIDSVVRCIELGAEDYLTKPFNPVLLRARVGSCLDKKRAHDRETHLYRQLHENYERLKTLEKLRDDLTNMIIHDLRTPLTSVIAGMQTLESMGKLDDDQREMVEMAIAGGQTLLGMINDLMDAEKLESGSMQLGIRCRLHGGSRRDFGSPGQVACGPQRAVYYSSRGRRSASPPMRSRQAVPRPRQLAGQCHQVHAVWRRGEPEGAVGGR